MTACKKEFGLLFARLRKPYFKQPSMVYAVWQSKSKISHNNRGSYYDRHARSAVS